MPGAGSRPGEERPDEASGVGFGLRPVWSKVPAAFWVIAYALGWYAAFHVSSIYWFLPAGLRVAALWLAPRRWWPALALGEWSVVVFGLGTADFYATTLGFVLAVFAPGLAHAAVVALLRGPRQLPDSPARMGRLLLSMAAAAASSAVLLTWMHLAENRIRFGSELSVGFDLLTGDLVAMVLIVPVVLQLASRSDGARRAAWRDFLMLFLPALGFCLLLARAWPAVAAHAAVLALAPMLLVAGRGGWRASAWAVCVTGMAVYAIGISAEPALSPALVQMVLTVIGSCALMLGAGTNAQQRGRQALAEANAALAEANRRLAERAEAIRALSRRVVDAQEAEQQRISREIHDELARATSTLGVSLGLEARRSGSPEMVAAVDSLRELVRELQARVRGAVERVAPARLDGAGLRAALESGALAASLREGGIAFQVQLSGRWEELDDDTAPLVYRFVHDVCWQAQRQGGVHGITVMIHTATDATRPEILALVRVSGREPTGDRDAGDLPGQRGIGDRVQAVGGRYAWRRLGDGVEHEARFVCGPARPRSGGD